MAIIPHETIAHAWTEFQRQCIPIKAPPIQQIEMRRAFYSGVIWLFGSLNQNMDMSDPKEPTEQDMEYMNGLQQEMEQFIKDLNAGHV